MNLFNIFKPKQEERAFNDLFLSGGKSYFATNNDNTKNVYIDQIPHLKKGTDLICGLISNLPIVLNQETEKNIKAIKNDDRLKLLNSEANFIKTSAKFKADMVRDLLLEGKAYAIIERNGNKPVSLHRVEHINTKTYTDNKGIPIEQEISYLLHGNQFTDKNYNMLIIENPNGGIINTNRQVLNDILEEYKTYKHLMDNTAKPLGVLQTEGKLNEEAISKLRTAWNNLYAGRKNAGKTIILENGLEYKPISNTIELVDLERQEKVIGGKIESLLNLPKGTLTEKGTHADEQTLLCQSINPLIVAIEQGINKALLLESEKEKGYKFVIDTREMLKTNDTEYQKGIIELFTKGIVTLKQSREMLDLPTNDIERDMKLLSLGHVIQYSDGEIYVPNMNVSSKENDNLGLGDTSNKDKNKLNSNLKANDDKQIKSNASEKENLKLKK